MERHFFTDRKITNQIPFRFTRGKSSIAGGGFFDESKVSDSDLKIVKLDEKYNYVGIKFSKFKEMMLNYINQLHPLQPQLLKWVVVFLEMVD